jgi:hypothetical protein
MGLFSLDRLEFFRFGFSFPDVERPAVRGRIELAQPDSPRVNQFLTDKPEEEDRGDSVEGLAALVLTTNRAIFAPEIENLKFDSVQELLDWQRKHPEYEVMDTYEGCIY